MNKLLIVGSQTIHTYNYIELIKDFFDDILLVTDKRREGYALKVKELDFSLKLKNLRETVRGIKKQIEEFKPTIIHIHQANSYAFYTLQAAKNFRIPVVLTIWGSDVLVNPKKNLLLKKITQYNLKKADYLTADSKYVAEEVIRLLKKEKEVLIANFGIGVQGQDLEKENIIYSNRLHKKLYRIDKIINAFHKFSSKNPDWKLIIAAVGEETGALKNQVSELRLSDKVEFVGWIEKDQNEYWYSKSKIWVSVPESDATSISLLEAMICGSIPIVSDLPANREWIHNEVNGIIVSDVNEEFISKALELVDLESARAMNKQLILKEGTKKANREKFIQLYKKILDK